MRGLIFFLICAAQLSAQLSADLEKKLDERITASLTKAGAASISVAVIQGDTLVYAKAFGSASLEEKRQATPATRYAVGSISKQFTAAALLLLQEQGKLSLDDKVSKFFPELTRANEITIRQLLSHTAGYEDFAPQDFVIPEWTRPTTPQTTLKSWAMKPLNFDPGTRWQYSNTNYVLAAEIFEKASGTSLVTFLREKIFQPLGMKSADAWPPFQPSDAVAYTRYATGPSRPASREADGWYFGAGELAMTPSDLAKWDIAFLQKKILSARSWDQFTREIKLANGDSTHYALGLSLSEISNMPAYTHGGETSGFISYNGVFPTHRGAVIVLSNQDGVNMVNPVAQQVARLVFLPEPQQPADTDAKRAQAVVEGLQKGEIDRSQLTANANSYFTEIALLDCKASLSALGKIREVTAVSQNLRGGMTHQVFRVQFDSKSLTLNIYVTSEGKYEQFMVEEQA